MQVVVFASTKGGVGKSTIAAIVADSVLRQGDTVRMIDFDPQGTLRKWAQPVAERNTRLKLSQVDLEGDATFAHYYNALLAEFENETDWVLIDTGGFDDVKQLAALAISDLVICPSGPIEGELLGVQKTVHYLEVALTEIGADADPLDMLRVIYRKPSGFLNAEMIRLRNLILNHFGAVDEVHNSSAMGTFLGNKQMTEEAITEGRDANPFRKIQQAADRLTENLKGQFDE